MKAIFIMGTILLLATHGQAQISNAKTVTVTINGNCGMCKTTIEKAGSKKKAYKTIWDETTQTATITYNEKMTTSDKVLKSIALAGYDNERFLAPDDAYQALPTCCQYSRKQKQSVPTTTTSNQGNHEQGSTNHLQQTIPPLKAVFDTYFGLTDALIKTDGKLAAAQANNLLGAIDTVPMEKLSSNVHTVWMQVAKDLQATVHHIGSTNNIAQQRSYFMSLSKTMYELIKVAQPNEPVYYQFCPMADGGKGAYWLSKEKAIKNPYYGAVMLTCGRTEAVVQ